MESHRIFHVKTHELSMATFNSKSHYQRVPHPASTAAMMPGSSLRSAAWSAWERCPRTAPCWRAVGSGLELRRPGGRAARPAMVGWEMANGGFDVRKSWGNHGGIMGLHGEIMMK